MHTHIYINICTLVNDSVNGIYTLSHFNKHELMINSVFLLERLFESMLFLVIGSYVQESKLSHYHSN